MRGRRDGLSWGQIGRLLLRRRTAVGDAEVEQAGPCQTGGRRQDVGGAFKVAVPHPPSGGGRWADRRARRSAPAGRSGPFRDPSFFSVTGRSSRWIGAPYHEVEHEKGTAVGVLTTEVSEQGGASERGSEAGRGGGSGCFAHEALDRSRPRVHPPLLDRLTAGHPAGVRKLPPRRSSARVDSPIAGPRPKAGPSRRRKADSR